MKPRRLFLILILLGIVAFLAWRFLPKNGASKEKTSAGRASQTVPVTVTKVVTADVPIWLSGLGTVQAFNMVTIRPQVSGALDEINFTEGQVVKDGDILARIDPRPYQSTLDQAIAKQAQSAAQLLNARQQLDRVNELVKSGAESRQVLEQLESSLAQASAQDQSDAAAIATARLNLDFTAVKSPIAGRTGVRLIDKGNLVTANQTGGLVVITQFQPISVIFTLPQSELPAIRKRMMEDQSPLITQAMTDDGKVLAEGKLEVIDNQIDVNSGTLKLKATFPNDDQALWPGQFVTARILVETRKQTLTLPTQAIQSGLDGPFAYLAKPDKTVEPRNVKIGPGVEGVTVIEDGLQAGDSVILDGHSKLKPGSKITIQPSAQP